MRHSALLVAAATAILVAGCDRASTPTAPEVDASAAQQSSVELDSIAAGAQAEKVELCHLDAISGTFLLIAVSQNALEKHLSHGDGLPGTVDFDDSCMPTACIARPDAVTWSGNGHAYEVVNHGSLLDWATARTAAESLSGYLVTLTSAEENSFVFALTMSHYAGMISPWTGGFQQPGSSEPDGGWSWITGEPFSFTSWQPGEPNNADDENLLVFGDGETWNDWADWRGDISGYVIEWNRPACGEERAE